ncbi:hypothetical protein CHH28_06720 [Bacterioplanes sanyensis]|uniref:Uncharacterized protein n=1 Tax=Bacterioplanes sanyensis TaxID=1249553 RepID=A0A222FIZ5_9GAMM|nr:hypothetical protein [Bacterioplanes sanyensis]ASP38391.1 hypothetical protein CHH28_06720 [Bacterioplanes sanyensis]
MPALLSLCDLIVHYYIVVDEVVHTLQQVVNEESYTGRLALSSEFWSLVNLNEASIFINVWVYLGCVVKPV